MPYPVHSDAEDAYLGVLAEATQILALESEPADRAEAVANALASSVYAAVDFSIGDSATVTGARELAIAQKLNVTASATGTVNFYALVDATRLLVPLPADGSAAVSGQLFTMQPGKVRLRDAEPAT